MKIGEYRFPLWISLCGGTVGLALCVLAPIAIMRAPAPHPYFSAAIVAACVIEGYWITIASFRSKAVLYSDAIEIHGAFRMRRLMRADVLSKTCRGINIFLWRERPRRWQWPFQVSAVLKVDQPFRDWMDSIPIGYPSEIRRRSKAVGV